MTVNRTGGIARWLKSLFSRERRNSDRQPSSNLSAHFWTGAAPDAQQVRDISPTGLYIETEQRWYPGTVVTMTLQKTDADAEDTERSILVKSKAVRTDSDGVGLAFVLPEKRVSEVADKKSLMRFLGLFQRGNI